MSTTHKATIELNGQKFDAYTGKPLPGAATSTSHAPAMSDVLPTKQHTSQRHTTHSKQMHKSPARSHTLMRSVVKKPIVSDIAPAVTHRTLTPSRQVSRSFHIESDIIRTKRAKQIPQSSLISRFGDIMNTPVHMTSSGTIQSDIAKRPVHPMDVVDAPMHHAPAALHHASKGAVHSVIEKGLRDAPNHTAPKAKKHRLHHRIGRHIGLKPRVASFGAGGLALLILGGFIAYQNVPNLAVRYASMKAGVKASLPSYHPAGFAINDRVKYSPGEVSVAYKANADNRSYTVTQKSSAWNNDSLKDYVASTSGQEPQSYPENGRTIYLYGDSNAAWVDSGVLYKISGDSDLNTDQLIKIASSM